MDEIDRKILDYLSSKEVIAWGAMAHETGITGEIIEQHLSKDSPLIEKDYVRIIWPAGNPKFATITERGRRALWPIRKHAVRFLAENWLIIVTAVASIIAALGALK